MRPPSHRRARTAAAHRCTVAFLAVALAVTALLAPVASLDEPVVTGLATRTPPPAPHSSSSDPLIVSLVDGTVLAVDAETGAARWAFDTGSPLVASAGLGPGERAWAGSGDGDDPSTAVGAIVPGADDGALYAFAPDAGLTRLGRGASVPALAAAGASMTADGGVVLGSVRTTVYLLDPDTGALVRAFTTSSAEDEKAGGEGAGGGDGWEGLVVGGEGGPPADDDAPAAPARPLALARHDYTVRAVDSTTGAPRWNVSWSRVAKLGGGSEGGRGGRDDTATSTPAAAAASESDDDGSLSTAQPGLWGVVATAHTLARRGGGAGAPSSPSAAEWSTRLPSPAVAAFDGTGAALPLSGGGGEGGRQGPGPAALVVGRVEGALYALPAPPGAGAAAAAAAAGAPSDSDDGDDDASASALPLGMHALLPLAGGEVGGGPAGLAHPPALLPLPPGEGGLAAAAAPRPRALTARLAAGAASALRSALGGAVLLLAGAAALRVARGGGPVAAPPPPAEEGKREAPSPAPPATARAAAAGPPARTPRGMSNKVRGALVAAAAEAKVGEEGGKENEPTAAVVTQPPSPPAPPPPPPAVHPRVDAGGGAVRVGRLTVGPDILGYGSGGTLVFTGTLDGPTAAAGAGGGPAGARECARSVAVKRVLRQFAGAAASEAAALVRTDAHPCVVRCHAVEEDAEFVYLALERCVESLADAVLRPAAAAALTSRADGRPSAAAREICRCVTAGLAALHARGIVHRDLKPANVLLTRRLEEAGAEGGGGWEGGGSAPAPPAPATLLLGGPPDAAATPALAKVSDMGLAKHLPQGATSFEPSRPAGAGGGGRGGAGSAGWTAPELLAGRAAAGGAPGAAGGPPPPSSRQGFSIDVFSLGLVLYHTLTGGDHPYGPAFERDFRIVRGDASFAGLAAVDPEAAHLCACAAARDPAARPPAAALLAHPFWWPPPARLAFLVALSDRVELEDRAGGGGGGGGGEAAPLPPIGGKRASRLLLALEAEAGRAALGGSPSSRPPWTARLDPALLAVPPTLRGPPRRLYDGRSLRDLLRLIRNKAAHWHELPPAARASVGPPPAAYVAYFTDRFPRLLLACFKFVGGHCAGEAWAAPWLGGGGGGPPAAAALLARWPAEDGGAGGAAGDDAVEGAPPDPTTASAPPAPAQPGAAPPFPRRPGEPTCSFYARTGHCRFGGACAFDHPPEHAVPRNADGLPLRPGAPPCVFYARTGGCKFGPACKFDHSMGGSGGGS